MHRQIFTNVGFFGVLFVAILTLTKSNRDATALQVEDLLMNIVGSAENSVPILSLDTSGAESSPVFASMPASADLFVPSEASHHVVEGEFSILISGSFIAVPDISKLLPSLKHQKHLCQTLSMSFIV